MHRFRFLFFLSLFVACGAQEQSADLLFREGEQATHDMASYPVGRSQIGGNF